MAHVTTGSTYGLTIKQTQICRMLAEGYTEETVMQLCYGIHSDSTQKEKEHARKALRKLYKLPGWAECYRAIVRDWAYDAHGQALKRITSQINDKNGWLANKASNDILTRFGPMVMGEESNQVKVIIEGMPTLGAPSVTEDNVDPGEE